MEDTFTQKAIQAILHIPEGKVSTYGAIAKQAGDNKGAQKVAEILHLLSKEYNLPWQRIINAQGRIAFHNPEQQRRQRILLEKEGVVFKNDSVNLDIYMFTPEQAKLDGFF